MGALTALMDSSVNSLMADQAALNATSNNVANQNTVGYTREVVNFQSGDAVTLSGGQMIGGAVSVTTTSVRDRVLEQRVQQQTQTQAQSATVASALQQVENVFGLSSTASSASSTALGSATDGFFSALTSLTGSPSSAIVRQSVLTAANTMASAFNSAAGQIAQIGTSLDQQVGAILQQVNTLTSTIASLNGKITATSPTSDAGALEDQRQAALGQLSQLIGVNQITTEGNGITLTTTNGAVLVSGSQSFAMSTAQVGGTAHVFAGVSPTDVTATISGGQLGGVLQVRDQTLPQYSNALDTLAYGIGSSLNSQNAAGLDGNGNPGAAIFSLPATSSGAAAAIGLATADPNAVAAAAIGEGSAGSTNATALANLGTTSIVSGQTASGFYAGLLGQIGSDAAGATTNDTAQQAVLTQLTTQRDSLSGVSLDQEAANLTQYQRSYEAAAKVFSVVDTLMASALNLGEATTVA